MLRRLNLCSGEAKARHYDHEVKGLSVVKPFVGVEQRRARRRHGLPGAARLAARLRALRGHQPVLLGHRHPRHGHGGRRRGGPAPARAPARDSTASRCWTTSAGPTRCESEETPDGAYKLAQLVRACRGLYEACRGLRRAADLRQGLDEERLDHGRGQDQRAADAAGLGDRPDRRRARGGHAGAEARRATSSSCWATTRDETGGSEYFRYLGERDGASAPLGQPGPTWATRSRGSTRRRRCRSTARWSGAIREGLVRSAATPAHGRLGAGLRPLRDGRRAGSGSGPRRLPRPDRAARGRALFSESNGRFLVTVAPRTPSASSSSFDGLPCRRVGEVTADPRLRVRLGERR